MLTLDECPHCGEQAVEIITNLFGADESWYVCGACKEYWPVDDGDDG